MSYLYRVTNPNMLAWGIEMGDMLVVEKNDSLFIGDLVVLEKQMNSIFMNLLV